MDFYVAELARICRRGGVAALTVKGYACCDRNAREGMDPAIYPHDRELLRAERVIYRDYPDPVRDTMEFAKTSSWGIAHVSPDYVRDNFGRCMDVVDIREAAIGAQDLVIMKK